MPKSIGMLLDGYYPSDIRVQKEAVALISAGFKVSLLCKRRKDEPEVDVVDGIELMRINTGTSHSQKGIMDILISLNFIHPLFKRKLPAFIQKYSIDVLHVHDLPLVKTAVVISKKYNIKVVADFHENYPEALKVWFQWKKNPLIRLKNRIFFSYDRWNNYEKWAVHNADEVIAVVDEMKTRLINDHGVAEDKIFVITNTESKSFVDDSKLNKNIYGRDKDKFIIAYTGGVGPHRGVDTVIEAISSLKDYENIVFYITGTLSKAAQDMIESAIKNSGLENKIHVLGYRPFSEFYSFMKMASVNIIPHKSNGHTDHTIPHKLFQCMMTGNPLIVSSSTPLMRVVNEAGSGLIFEAGNSIDLAEKILSLYENNEERIFFGKNGYDAVIKKYNWESTAEELISFYASRPK